MILAVEDEPLLLMALVDELESEGLTVLSATSGEDALRLLERRHADVAILFTDINLGGALDGLSLARMAHSRWSHISLFLTSGRFAWNEDELPFPGRFIPKPYTYRELAAELSEMLPGSG
jgi:DNA-binding response OmpR family regulator